MPDSTEFEAVVPSDLRHLIPVFLENRQKDLYSIMVAIAADDFEMLRQIGHRMKGSGNSYGFAAISSLGMQIEQRAKVSDKSELIRLLAKYRQYLANVKIKYADG
jgi:HPt (histidine-containing phosphotransfer) domain-containing protein